MVPNGLSPYLSRRSFCTAGCCPVHFLLGSCVGTSRLESVSIKFPRRLKWLNVGAFWPQCRMQSNVAYVVVYIPVI